MIFSVQLIERFNGERFMFNIMSLRDQTKSRGNVTKLVYNDRLGYAIAYYEPLHGAKIRIFDDKPPKQRKLIKNSLKVPEVVDSISLETQELIRKKQLENTADDIREACASVRTLFRKCEERDLSRRDVLSDHVKLRIRGKSANEICDILVDDVLNHVKHIYKQDVNVDAFPHKMKYKIKSAAVKRAPSPSRIRNKYITEDEDCSADDTPYYHVPRYPSAEAYEGKTSILIEKMRKDIIHLKSLCESFKI